MSSGIKMEIAFRCNLGGVLVILRNIWVVLECKCGVGLDGI